MQLTISVRPRLAALAAVLLVAAGAASAREASAATPLTVAQASATQNGSSNTVVGYVVGEPMATNTVNTSSFSADYALALADSATRDQHVQDALRADHQRFRAAFGLKSNPSLMGQQLDRHRHADGVLLPRRAEVADRVRHAGGTPPPTPTGTSTTGPYDSTYYANAIGKTRHRPCGRPCTRSSATRRSSPTTRSGTP